MAILAFASAFPSLKESKGDNKAQVLLAICI